LIVDPAAMTAMAAQLRSVGQAVRSGAQYNSQGHLGGLSGAGTFSAILATQVSQAESYASVCVQAIGALADALQHAATAYQSVDSDSTDSWSRMYADLDSYDQQLSTIKAQS